MVQILTLRYEIWKEIWCEAIKHSKVKQEAMRQEMFARKAEKPRQIKGINRHYRVHHLLSKEYG